MLVFVLSNRAACSFPIVRKGEEDTSGGGGRHTLFSMKLSLLDVLRMMWLHTYTHLPAPGLGAEDKRC